MMDAVSRFVVSRQETLEALSGVMETQKAQLLLAVNQSLMNAETRSKGAIEQLQREQQHELQSYAERIQELERELEGSQEVNAELRRRSEEEQEAHSAIRALEASNEEKAEEITRYQDTVAELQNKVAAGEEAYRKVVQKLLLAEAERIIRSGGGLIRFAELGAKLYERQPDARKIVDQAGGIKKWLQMWPGLFKLHGLERPGHEKVTLQNSPVSSLAEANIAAVLETGPSNAGAQSVASDTTTSEATVKKVIGGACIYGDKVPPKSPEKRELDLIKHSQGPDPHKKCHNRYAEMSKENFVKASKDVTREAKAKQSVRAG